VDAVRDLVALAAGVNHADSDGFTPLETAIAVNDVGMIRALAAIGADVNATRKIITPSRPVHVATSMGCIDALRALVELGADVNTPAEDCKTPMYIAAQEGKVATIRALAELGANIDTSDKNECTPVYIAAQEGQVDSIRALAELGADINTPDEEGSTPAYIAAHQGQVDSIRALAELGADINTPDDIGHTPVYIAAQEGQVASIRALAELGADINTPDEEGTTPVYIAAHEGQVATIRALVELGGDINTVDAYECTPMYIAAYMGHMHAMRALLKLRANIDVRRAIDGSSLLLQILHHPNIYEHRRREASLLLVNNGADVMECLIHMEHIHLDDANLRNMMTQLFDDVCLSSNRNYDGPALSVAKCGLFSLTKLMSSAACDDDDGDDDDDDDDVDNEEILIEHHVFETAIASILQQQIPIEVITPMQGINYVLKRRLVRIAWRVYQSSLLLDGDRLTVSTKAHRYMELVCFLFDITMLSGVMALRMTCKSNSERRRFPLCYVTYQELEANIIEEFIAYGSSRFVSTDIICAVMAIHQL
jgi:ankyrin repeat protein